MLVDAMSMYQVYLSPQLVQEYNAKTGSSILLLPFVLYRKAVLVGMNETGHMQQIVA